MRMMMNVMIKAAPHPSGDDNDLENYDECDDHDHADGVDDKEDDDVYQREDESIMMDGCSKTDVA